MSSVTLSSRRLQSPLAESSAHKSGGSTQLLQPQRLNNPLLSQEDMNIIKRDEDTRSIPVGQLWVTLNTRATGPQIIMFSLLDCMGLSPRPLLH